MTEAVTVKRKPEQIIEGGRYMLNAQRKKLSRFWKHFNGKVCTVVSISDSASAAIVEVEPAKELICCYLRDLEPMTRS
jgi:hypothetical protein